MDFTILSELGINVKEARKRFVGNDKLYAKMMQKFIEDPTYNNLLIAAETNDAKKILAEAHSLKGLCGILSITPLFGLFTEQVALLRSGECEKALALMPEIIMNYEKTTQAIGRWLSENTVTPK